MPLFSVIIPAYNAEAFIGEAIQSVLVQSEPDFEIIVIDDGSTDRTAPIANAFTDSRIKVISNPPSGRPAVPRNTAIRFSSGELIAFLDADDAWPANKLAVFRETADLHSAAGLFFSNGLVSGPDGRFDRQLLPESTHLSNIPQSDEILVLLNYIPLSSVVLRRSVLRGRNPLNPDRKGGDTPNSSLFDERPALRAVEDYLLWLHLNLRTSFHYLPEPLLFKRRHAGNISADRVQQLQRLHTLLDCIEGSYSREIVRLARKLYAARYHPTAANHFKALLEIIRAFARQPIHTARRLGRLLSFSLNEPKVPAPSQNIDAGKIRQIATGA